MKVNEKGAVSVYAHGRFPDTLYQEQWLKLLVKTDAIKQFVEENPEIARHMDLDDPAGTDLLRILEAIVNRSTFNN